MSSSLKTSFPSIHQLLGLVYGLRLYYALYMLACVVLVWSGTQVSPALQLCLLVWFALAALSF